MGSAWAMGTSTVTAELQPVSPPCRAPPRGTPRGCSPPGGVRSWLRAGAMKKAVLSRTQDERRHSPPSGLRTSKKSSPQISFWSPRSCKDKDKDKDTHVRGCLEMASGTGRPVSRAETRGKPPHRHPWGLHCLHPAPSKCPGKAPGLGAPEHPRQQDSSPSIPPAPWGARGTVTEQGAQGSPFDEVHALVPLQHHEPEGREGQKRRVPRHVLQGNSGSSAECSHRAPPAVWGPRSPPCPSPAPRASPGAGQLPALAVPPIHKYATSSEDDGAQPIPFANN